MPRCYADPNPNIQPAMRLIAGITNSSPAVITTTFPHLYITGTIVRLDLPLAVGMQQASGQFGPITVLSPTTFSLPLDTTGYDPFVIPAPAGAHDDICAQVVPIGEINSTLDAAVQNVLL